MKNLWKWFLEVYKFKYVCVCKNVGLNACCAITDSMFPLICTRKAGHTGDHVACGTTEHRLKVWRK